MTFEQRLQSIEELIRGLAAADPNLRDRVDRLLRAVMELHGTAVERLLEMAHEADAGLIERLGRDPLVGSLLVLHGLHPLDLEARVREAVAAISGAEVVSVIGGAVRLRVGSANRAAMEMAVQAAAPDAASVEIESTGFVPLAALSRGKA